MDNLLEQITDPGDIKGLKPDQLRQLADESRAYLIEALSGTGGHLASNLGVVELTIALHSVFSIRLGERRFVMSDANITKQALANSLKGLMAKKAFSKICVSDIVNDCGLTRQAFYYHFKDKYDLMNWIYYTETARFMSSYSTAEHWMDGLTDLCNYMRQNKTFYMNALNTTGQNSFQEYLHDYLRDISIVIIENIKNTEFEEEKWGFIVEFISTAFVGLIVRWANNGMKGDPAEYVMKMRSLFDGSILCELESQSEEISTENPTKPG